MLIEQIRLDMNAALKAKEKERKGVLSSLLDALTKYEKSHGKMTESDEFSVLQKERKQMEETLSFARQASNDVMIQKCEYALQIMDAYLPQMMTENQIRDAVATALRQLGITTPTKADKGKLMKALSGFRGVADMKMVSNVVDRILQQ